MTPREEFFQLFAALSSMCGAQMDHFTLKLYDQELSRMGYDRAAQAVRKIIVSRRGRDPLPSIREIEDVANPEVSIESKAVLESSKIMEAITRIGPYESAEAKKHMGDIAWKIVQLEGGWENLCEIVNRDNAAVYKAQWRKMAVALLESETVKENTEQVMQLDSKIASLIEFKSF